MVPTRRPTQLQRADRPEAEGTAHINILMNLLLTRLYTHDSHITSSLLIHVPYTHQLGSRRDESAIGLGLGVLQEKTTVSSATAEVQ